MGCCCVIRKAPEGAGESADFAVALGDEGLITLAHDANPVETATLDNPLAGFDGKAIHEHLVVAGVRETNQLSAIGRDQEVAGAGGESGDGCGGHGLVCGGVAPCPLIMGYTPAIWQAPRWSLRKSSIQAHTSAAANAGAPNAELPESQVRHRVTKVVKTRLLIWIALVVIRLQLQALDQPFASF